MRNSRSFFGSPNMRGHMPRYNSVCERPPISVSRTYNAGAAASFANGMSAVPGQIPREAFLAPLLNFLSLLLAVQWLSTVLSRWLSFIRTFWLTPSSDFDLFLDFSFNRLSYLRVGDFHPLGCYNILIHYGNNTMMISHVHIRTKVTSSCISI